jgi:hypothetical protein
MLVGVYVRSSDPENFYFEIGSFETQNVPDQYREGMTMTREEIRETIIEKIRKEDLELVEGLLMLLRHCLENNASDVHFSIDDNE